MSGFEEYIFSDHEGAVNVGNEQKEAQGRRRARKDDWANCVLISAHSKSPR